MATDTRRRGRFFPAFVLGLVTGALFAVIGPNWWHALLPDSLFPGGAMESVVLAESLEKDRLLLKLETPNGVLLATFTQKVEEIDLLVETGDRITLRVSRYQPFLTDPRVEKVVKGKIPVSAPETTTSSPSLE
ncbi:MAG TPA: hypothetical protein VIG29_09685 [Vicinamibacteria bacterium]|jgi:hypothetical protein